MSKIQYFKKVNEPKKAEKYKFDFVLLLLLIGVLGLPILAGVALGG